MQRTMWNLPRIRRPKAKELVTRIRMRLADMQGTKFSDYELTAALNDALGMLWIALAESWSSIPRKTVQLMLEHGVAPLPDDFYSLVEISDGAGVNGLYVEGDGDRATVVYNAVPRPVSLPDEEVDTPLSLVLDTVEIAVSIARGDSGNAAEIALSSAKRLSQKREFGALPDPVPFP